VQPSAPRRQDVGAKDVGARAISCAGKNVQASLEYAGSLLHAKDPTGVMRRQGQMRSLAEQASEIGSDRPPRGDGCCQIDELSTSRRGGGPAAGDSPDLHAMRRKMLPYDPGPDAASLCFDRTIIPNCPGNAHLVRAAMRRCTRNCVALHKIDMIWVFTMRCPTMGAPDTRVA
jgi:hypothetical protein